MQVGDTKYKVEAGGGLGFDLVVTITSTDPFTATFSETYQTIIGLLNAGKIVVGVADNNWAPIYKRSANSVECDMFRNIGPTTMSIIGYTLTSTDTTSIAEYEFTIST